MPLTLMRTLRRAPGGVGSRRRLPLQQHTAGRSRGVIGLGQRSQVQAAQTRTVRENAAQAGGSSGARGAPRVVVWVRLLGV